MSVGVSCIVDYKYETIAFIDTGADYSILPVDIATSLNYDIDIPVDWKDGQKHPDIIGYRTARTGDSPIPLRLTRVTIDLIADEGDSLSIEVTCGVSPDWYGPLVIGWNGCLDKFSFAIVHTTPVGENTQTSFLFDAP